MAVRRDAALVGWFGPIGVAALNYASVSATRTGNSQIWIIASLIVFSSVLVHGVTETPLVRLYGRVAAAAER